MDLKTKYNLKDKVFMIEQGGYNEFVNCSTCLGRGIITISETGEEITCTICFGRKGRQIWNPIWKLREAPGIIENVRVNVFTEEFRLEKEPCTNSYMISSTGIRSGTIWPEDRLFLTIEEAKAECDERNKELKEM